MLARDEWDGPVAEARALVPVASLSEPPERLVFGKPWLDNSGLTFSRNDQYELYAFRKVGRVNYVYSMESVAAFVNAPSDARIAAILGLVPEALTYVGSLRVGEAFPLPMRQGRPPEPPKQRWVEAVAAARVVAARDAPTDIRLGLEILADSNGRVDPRKIASRMQTASEEQLQAVQERLQDLRTVLLGHGAILHAVSFRGSWDNVISAVARLENNGARHSSYFDNMFSHSLRLLRDHVAGPSERLVGYLDAAHSALRDGLRQGKLKELGQHQFSIWRECRRLIVFFEPLTSLWELVETETEARASVEALVRTTLSRLRSYQ